MEYMPQDLQNTPDTVEAGNIPAPDVQTPETISTGGEAGASTTVPTDPLYAAIDTINQQIETLSLKIDTFVALNKISHKIDTLSQKIDMLTPGAESGSAL